MTHATIILGRPFAQGTDPMAYQRKNSSLSERKILNDELTKTPTPCLPALSGKEEGTGGRKRVLRASFTSNYPPLTLLIRHLFDTFKFEPVLPYQWVFPLSSSLNFLPLICPTVAFFQCETTTLANTEQI